MVSVEHEDWYKTLVEQWKDRHPAYMKVAAAIRSGAPETERVALYMDACQQELEELKRGVEAERIEPS